jgi:hypothetical protein
MKIAILSDSHDHLENTKKVLDAVQECEAMIFCGDGCAPFAWEFIADNFSKPIYAVLGNVDGDPNRITERMLAKKHVTLYPEHGEFQLGGKKVGLVHYTSIGRPMVASGQYDLVCCGHTHKVEIKESGKALMVNPGDIMGRFDSRAHYAIYDTETGNVDLQAIDVNPA